MAPPMTRIALIRLAVFSLPFLVWLVWSMVARRTGVPAAATPWAWLVAAGAALAALSLLITLVIPHGRDRGVYVPGEVTADGHVTRGHFAPRASSGGGGGS